jgi:hypothetical protein
MDTISALLAVSAGLLLRLALPIAATVVAIHLLRRLDARWQAEAKLDLEALDSQVEKPECWKAKNCLPTNRKVCPGYQSAKPCWQAFRAQNGYLREACLTCEVFLAAPIQPVRVAA